MSRIKFKTLTEQMYYILLCLRNECCGTDIMEMVSQKTNGRVEIGPGTLYNLLMQFAEEDIIRETKAEGRRRSYIITPEGENILQKERDRLVKQIEDYERIGHERD